MAKRFYVIIIDSGWPTTAHDVLQRSLGLLKEYLEGQHLIILSKEDSCDFLKEHPEHIDKDPIIIITDTDPKKINHRKEEEISGIRIDLGNVNNKDEIIKYLQDLCQLIRNESFVSDITWEERKKIANTFFKDVVKEVLIKFLELVI